MKCNTAVGDNDEPSGYGFRLRLDESGRILLLGDSAELAGRFEPGDYVSLRISARFRVST